jgi:hypothetical protein
MPAVVRTVLQLFLSFFSLCVIVFILHLIANLWFLQWKSGDPYLKKMVSLIVAFDGGECVMFNSILPSPSMSAWPSWSVVGI